MVHVYLFQNLQIPMVLVVVQVAVNRLMLVVYVTTVVLQIALASMPMVQQLALHRPSMEHVLVALLIEKHRLIKMVILFLERVLVLTTRIMSHLRLMPIQVQTQDHRQEQIQIRAKAHLHQEPIQTQKTLLAIHQGTQRLETQRQAVAQVAHSTEQVHLTPRA